VGVVTFPGSCDDRDALAAVSLMGAEPVALWHGDDDLRGADAVILPGGFSYGDYLRCGAIARFSPVMAAVAGLARAGGPVLGICNGFQVLCEAGLLPGALLRNAGLRFVCRQVEIEVRSTSTVWTGRCLPGGPGGLPLRGRAQPQRLAGGHRRGVEPARQRGRPDAAPRACGRPPARPRRWPCAVREPARPRRQPDWVAALHRPQGVGRRHAG
jgi:hypothetical protein